jgi:hypothetical protein
VVTFSWKSLCYRIPTRDNVISRGVVLVDQDIQCHLYEGNSESTPHNLLHCDHAMEVWHQLFCWLDLVIVISGDLFLLVSI